jgi:uncharacterized protein (TIGR00251 family)
MSEKLECILAVKAVPNASHCEVVGWLGDALKVSPKAPPLEGNANAELCRFMAEILGLPKSAGKFVTGASSRQKRIHIIGLNSADLRRRLPS